MHALDHAVGALIRRVAADIVMPRFRTLAAADIVEKSPGELVTIADREAEVALTAGLSAINPTARVIGEEAVATDPTLLDAIGTGRLWLVDPVDGTANFAAGREPFGIIVALVENGVPLASWIFDPVNDRMCHAASRAGSYANGKRLTATGSGAARPIMSIGTHLMTPAQADLFEKKVEGQLDLVPSPRCAAENYPRLVLGKNDVALFARGLPWDHAAGALFLAEAGGKVAWNDGTPYRVGDRQASLLAAASPALWDQAAAILFA